MRTPKSSPHLKNTQKLKTWQTMWWVNMALFAPIITTATLFGFEFLGRCLMLCIIAIALEYALVFAQKRHHLSALKVALDGSVVISTLLLALSLPPFMPLWVMVVVLIFMIGIVKHCYGGLGNNIFNPAMAGFAFAILAFPLHATLWPQPDLANFLWLIAYFTDPSIAFEATSSATPLSQLNQTEKSQWHTLVDFVPQTWAWFILNLASLIAGLCLLAKQVADWRLPLSFLLTLSVGLSLLSVTLNLELSFVLLGLFTGGTMLAAFFIVTDPVTAATSIKGRWVYGAMIAILTLIIRHFSGAYPDAIAFAILLTNLARPLIDRFTLPKRYGF